MSISIKKQHKTTNEKRLYSIDLSVNIHNKKNAAAADGRAADFSRSVENKI
jgi:hypothetical protein